MACLLRFYGFLFQLQYLPSVKVAPLRHEVDLLCRSVQGLRNQVSAVVAPDSVLEFYGIPLGELVPSSRFELEVRTEYPLDAPEPVCVVVDVVYKVSG